MEEYNAWIFLQDKWPLLLAVVAVIATIVIVRIVGAKKQKKQDQG